MKNEGRVLVLRLSETWLDDSIADAELEVPDLHRKNRNRRGGSVMKD